MTAPTTTDYLKYANLQMAAEAFLVADDGSPKTETDFISALIRGNDHSSRFTEPQALSFADPVEGWAVLDQCANTTTGFSGTLFKSNKTDELVLSFRSTEFIDDAARDNLATNTLEIKDTGFAWGQLSDMESWYAHLRSDPHLIGDKAFTVTGYSLGGHLATAFNVLHPDDAQQVITFNGAGIGQVKQGTLNDALQTFIDLRNDPNAIAAQLDDPALADTYLTIRNHLLNDAWTTQQAKNAITLLYTDGIIPQQAKDLLTALDEIEQLHQQVQRIATLSSDGNGQGTHPKEVLEQDILAEQLDYRMAVNKDFGDTHSLALLQRHQPTMDYTA